MDDQTRSASSGSGLEAGRQAVGDTAQTGADKAREVKDTAVDQAQAVKDEARDQLGSLAAEMKGHANDVFSSASSDLNQQLGDRISRGASMARTRAGELRALAEGRPEDAGPLGDWARQAADRLGQMADRAEELGPRGVVNEVSDFARRRPAAFLFGAAMAGIMVGRLGRASREATSSSGPSGDGQTAGALPARSTTVGAAGPTGPGTAAGAAPMTGPAAAPPTTAPTGAPLSGSGAAGGVPGSGSTFGASPADAPRGPIPPDDAETVEGGGRSIPVPGATPPGSSRGGTQPGGER